MSPNSLQIATLLYCFNADGKVLLMQRKRQPNQGLWSPPGGKLNQKQGESPHACAAREAGEELGIAAKPEDFMLTGIVSEKAYEGEQHWMMFLFKYKGYLLNLPPAHEEGHFDFFSFSQIENLNIPDTDRNFIWPLFRKHSKGFFAVECDCQLGNDFNWKMLQSNPATSNLDQYD